MKSIALVLLIASTACAAAAARTTLEFRLIVACAPGTPSHVLNGTGETLCTSPDLIADLSNVTSAAVGFVYGNEAIRVMLDDAAAARMKKATSHDGVRMGILFDGALISAPTVYGPVSREVEVDFGEHGVKLKEVAIALRTGMGRK